MLLASLKEVEKVYGEQIVLDDAGLEIRAEARLALIGRNGAGKSTLLRLLMRQEEPDDGEIYIRRGAVIAMLEQDPVFDDSITVLAMAEQAFYEFDVLEERLAMLADEGLEKPEIYARWEEVHEIYQRRGGYERRSRRDAVLLSLGFRGREHEQVRHLSGGEKTRLGLAKLLMEQPDILLLDEPTNHLDMAMREWLEGYLGRYPGGVVIVSHDRAFLDAACNQTAEIKFAILRHYKGNPTAYKVYRAEQERIEEATRKNQQKEHDRLESAAEQMKQWAGQNAKLHRRAKAMFKRLDRYEATMLEDAEGNERSVRFQFVAGRSGDIVLHAEHLAKGFAAESLFKDVAFTLRRGERIALVGPNGAGKSTFLKVIMGDLSSDDPRAYLRFGTKVRVGYYDQELKGVNPDFTLMDEMIRMAGDVEAHNLLGRFLFPFDAQFKRIADLSGGEKARLALLKLTLGQYNFLVLDEPTNHLDVEMIEAVETALQLYEGTLLLVSHDRRFIQQTANRIWEIQDGCWTDFEGDWDYYQYRKKKLRAEPQSESVEKQGREELKGAQKTPSKWQLARDLEGLEERIASLEDQLQDINQQLSDVSSLRPEAIAGLGQAHSDTEAQLVEVMLEWEQVGEMLEDPLVV